MFLGVCGSFFEYFRINGVFWGKKPQKPRNFWEIRAKILLGASRADFLGGGDPVGARALWTEIGDRSIKVRFKETK